MKWAFLKIVHISVLSVSLFLFVSFIDTHACVSSSLGSLKPDLGPSFLPLPPAIHSCVSWDVPEPPLTVPRSVLGAMQAEATFPLGELLGALSLAALWKYDFVFGYLAPILKKPLWKAFIIVLRTGPPKKALHQWEFCLWIKNGVLFQIGH